MKKLKDIRFQIDTMIYEGLKEKLDDRYRFKVFKDRDAYNELQSEFEGLGDDTIVDFSNQIEKQAFKYGKKRTNNK